MTLCTSRTGRLMKPWVVGLCLILLSCKRPQSEVQFISDKVDVSTLYQGFAELTVPVVTTAPVSLRFAATCHCVEILEPKGVVHLKASSKRNVVVKLFVPENASVRQALFARDSRTGEILASCSIIGDLRVPLTSHKSMMKLHRPSQFEHSNHKLHFRIADGFKLVALNPLDSRVEINGVTRNGRDVFVFTTLAPSPDGECAIRLEAKLAKGARKSIVPLELNSSVESSVTCDVPRLWLGALKARQRVRRMVRLRVVRNANLTFRSSTATLIAHRTSYRTGSHRWSFISAQTDLIAPARIGPFTFHLQLYLNGRSVGSLPFSGIVSP